MTNQIIGRQILRYQEIDSTNDEAKRLIKQGIAGEGSVVIALGQKAGRGKPGSRWFSPPGSLYLSVIVKPYINPKDLAPITQLGARAVVRSIAKICGLTASIKQPNDVLVEGKKVSGVLVEKVGSGEVVIGIGVNIGVKFTPELAEKAFSLDCDRELFESELLACLNDEYLAYLSKIC